MLVLTLTNNIHSLQEENKISVTWSQQVSNLAIYCKCLDKVLSVLINCSSCCSWDAYNYGTKSAGKKKIKFKMKIVTIAMSHF